MKIAFVLLVEKVVMYVKMLRNVKSVIINHS